MPKGIVQLGAEQIAHLTDDQIVAWYSRHPSLVVQALVARIALNNEKHKAAVIQSFEDGVRKNITHNPHRLSVSELELAARYGSFDD